FLVNVSGADFSDAKTTDAHATGVDWSEASVPPAEIPNPIPIPPWVPAVFAGLGALLVLGIIVARKRRKKLSIS
ncbi:MAG: LPXTG cell wall anchor domain-containing protein, partial [Chloroflexota bacterium]